MKRLLIRFLGVGASQGTPTATGNWGACDPLEPRNHRTRSSLLIRYWGGERRDPTQCLIDAAPELRAQAIAASLTRLDAVIFSHEHADQTHGIDDLRAFFMERRARLPAFADAATLDELRQRFSYCFAGKSGFYPALLDDRLITAGEVFSVNGPGGDLAILPIAQDHGGRPSLGFRIGQLAYCNDVLRLPAASLELLVGVKALIADATKWKTNPAHAHISRALLWAEKIDCKRLILTNLHHDLDYRRTMDLVNKRAELAFDGMEIGFNFP